MSSRGEEGAPLIKKWEGVAPIKKEYLIIRPAASVQPRPYSSMQRAEGGAGYGPSTLACSGGTGGKRPASDEAASGDARDARAPKKSKAEKREERKAAEKRERGMNKKRAHQTFTSAKQGMCNVSAETDGSVPNSLCQTLCVGTTLLMHAITHTRVLAGRSLRVPGGSC